MARRAGFRDRVVLRQHQRGRRKLRRHHRPSVRVRRHVVDHLVLLGLLDLVRRRVHLLDLGLAPRLSLPTRRASRATRRPTSPSRPDCHACGNCFYSPNYLAGSGYDNDAWHNCDIAVLQDGWLDVVDFRRRVVLGLPDHRRRRLRRDRRSSGRVRHDLVVHHVLLGLHEQLQRGRLPHLHELHLHGHGLPPPTVSPTMPCDTATGFVINSGDCTACGACFHTPNYLSGDNYDHYHSCSITPMADGWLEVLDFQIETYFDDITVDGIQYDGYGPAQGPQGIVWVDTSTSISFYSDYSVAYDGAYICLSTTPPPTANPLIRRPITCDPATAFSVTSGSCTLAAIASTRPTGSPGTSTTTINRARSRPCNRVGSTSRSSTSRTRPCDGAFHVDTGRRLGRQWPSTALPSADTSVLRDTTSPTCRRSRSTRTTRDRGRLQHLHERHLHEHAVRHADHVADHHVRHGDAFRNHGGRHATRAAIASTRRITSRATTTITSTRARSRPCKVDTSTS